MNPDFGIKIYKKAKRTINKDRHNIPEYKQRYIKFFDVPGGGIFKESDRPTKFTLININLN